MTLNRRQALPIIGAGAAFPALRTLPPSVPVDGGGSETDLWVENLRRGTTDLTLASNLVFRSGSGARTIEWYTGASDEYLPGQIYVTSNKFRFRSPSLTGTGGQTTELYSGDIDIWLGGHIIYTKYWTFEASTGNLVAQAGGNFAGNDGLTYRMKNDLDTGFGGDGADTAQIFAGDSSNPQVTVDDNATAGNTRLSVYDVDNATLERVSVGAADSGGTNFKVLRIPN